jgi:selenocysteine lyase/cysteine desulfurase
MAIGIDRIHDYEQELIKYLFEQLATIPNPHDLWTHAKS